MAYHSKSQVSPQRTGAQPTPPQFVPTPPIQAKADTEGNTALPTLNLDAQNYQVNATHPLAGMYGHNPATTSQPIQAKLTVGAVGDKYEQEADQVAAQVVQNINSPTSPQSAQRDTVQREALEEEELQMKPVIQREALEEEELQMKPSLQREALEEEELQMKPAIQRVGTQGGAVSNDLEQQIQSAKGSGQSLDPNLQSQMGQAMGADFSNVKIHTDTQSHQLNQSVQAKAFTTGQDIFFREGEYNPSSKGGQELIAHELTHVVQQNQSVARKAKPNSPSISRKADSSTHTSGGGCSCPRCSGTAATAVQRKVDNTTSPLQTNLVDTIGVGLSHLKRKSADADLSNTSIQRQPDIAIQRKIITIGTEKVSVNSKDGELTEKGKKEKAEAIQIINTLKDKYGVDISSPTLIEGIKQEYPDAPDDVKDALRTRHWKMVELRALAEALSYYSPILGDERENSTRKGTDQEVTAVGKVRQAIDEDTPAGALDTSTLGEYFESKKVMGLFKASESFKADFGDLKKQLVGTFVHEIAHGLLAYAYDDFAINATGGYWLDQDTKTGSDKAEDPPTDYGKTNAREDLCESAMFYFVEPATLKSRCPKRFAYMQKLGKAWIPPVKKTKFATTKGEEDSKKESIKTRPRSNAVTSR
jgi:hypothetical protein